MIRILEHKRVTKATEGKRDNVENRSDEKDLIELQEEDSPLQRFKEAEKT